MALVASVRLPFDPRTRWFDPKGMEIHAGDDLIVRTARGLEFGKAVGEVAEVDDLQVKNLRSPLQPVVRLATDEDRARHAEMQQKSDEALPVFKRLAAQTNENMHPVMVQYLFDGNRAVFLFEAEERTDFRELVRQLSGELHVHVDMRQIGVRDEARIVGGIGHCGQELCCARMGGEIFPVSIKMAKAQDLSLNPQQISGVCGRLMCCLRYEYETYKDFKARAPKNNATIATPEGDFKVCQLDTPHEEVVLRTNEGKRVRIPLEAFDKPAPDAESQRPRSIGDAYYEYAEASQNGSRSVLLVGSTERFTGTDKLAEKGELHRNPTRSHGTEHRAGDEKKGGGHRRRRRPASTRGGQGSAEGRTRSGEGSGAAAGSGHGQHSGQGNRGGQRHGSGEGRTPSHRRSRNRNHNMADDQRTARAEGGKQGSAQDAPARRERPRRERAVDAGKPGRGSEKREPQAKNGAGKGAADGPNASQHRSGGMHPSKNQATKGGQAHRRPRRRTHKTGGTTDAV